MRMKNRGKLRSERRLLKTRDRGSPLINIGGVRDEKKGNLMRENISLGSIISAGLLAVFCAFVAPEQAQAQVRGVYTPGFNATNSGVLPEPGLTYANTFLDYSFNQVKGPNGERLNVNGTASVFVDVNVFLYVSKKKILGANYAVAAGLPVSNSAIESVTLGAVAGGGGFSDSFYQPITLGWHFKRADIQAAYAFFAPTGRFSPGATNNTGTGHWTNAPTAGETIYLTKNKGTAFSAYQMYEFHTNQKGTSLHPGQTFDLDYSLTQVLPLQKNMHTLLQVGLIGYGQYQTTDKTGPGVNPTVAANTHYRVNALGGAANIILPVRKVSLGFKALREFSNKSTLQGYSIQITGAITF